MNSNSGNPKYKLVVYLALQGGQCPTGVCQTQPHCRECDESEKKERKKQKYQLINSYTKISS
jgi:hypothetical protein